MELDHLTHVFNKDCCDSLDPETALEYAQQIHNFFKNPLDFAKLDQYLGLTFPDGDGLLQFLINKLTVKKFNSSKEQILLIIKLIFQREDKLWRQHVFPFCKRLANVANLYWKNSHELSKHQQLALDCLNQLMQNYGTELEEPLDLSTMCDELLVASEKTSYQPSVRGKMFQAIGLIASIKYEFKYFKKQSFDQLIAHILFNIKTQVEGNAAHLEVAILHGCLKAMDKILLFYESFIDLDSQQFRNFYNHLEQLIDPKCSITSDETNQFQIKRREFQRAGLELIANNGKYFKKHFYQNFEQWYNDLLAWAKSNNHVDSAAGRKAMFTFLDSAIQYPDCSVQSQQTAVNQKFTSYFLGKFEEIISLKNVNRSELLIALKGIGLLSTVCTQPQQINPIFDKILEHVSRIVAELNNLVTDKYSSSISMVSAYLESVGCIIPTVEVIPDDQKSISKFLSHLNLVEQLAVHLMNFYPDLSEKVRKNYHASISFLKIVQGLQEKHPYYCTPFIDRVFKDSLCHIIASPTKSELDILFESYRNSSNNGKVARSSLKLWGVKSYTQFWINLMKGNSQATVELLYDRVMHWTFTTIEKLDLTLDLLALEDQNEIGSGSGDILSNMTANVPKDFHLLVNLVEFLQDFLVKTDSTLFEKWAPEFISKVIILIDQNPLVSGFYKMLAAAMEVLRQLSYFKNQENLERKNLLMQCNSFLKSLTNKTNEFRDDLLISVLELWLAAPDMIVIQNFGILTQTLQVIFSVGRTCFGLADRCIDALDRWIAMEEFPRLQMEDLIRSLFPIWQGYFVSEGVENQFRNLQEQSKTSRSTSLAQQHKFERDEKKQKQFNKELDETTLKKVQLKLLHLIGSFGHILDLECNSSTGNALEIEDKVLKYSVPFKDIKPDIYFDALLPRVFELCLNSAERQVRASACEMLHTLILYFLGYSVRSTGSSQNNELFSKIFRVAVKLSCDSDIVVRQLFNPLTIQCVHWFTKQKHDYADITLQIIMDGLAQAEDAQLRDFSAACVSEYFNWALKHGHKSMANKVLEFIVALSTHAASQYRLGAVVGFNGIYRDFREDTEIWNNYTIILTLSFVKSLSLASTFEENSVLIKTTKLSILHLERILVRKKENFNNKIGPRKRPFEIQASIPCLRDLAEWLFAQAGRAERVCRQESIRLLKVIGPLVRGAGSLETFLQSFQPTENIVKFVNLAEISKETCLRPTTTAGLIHFLEASSEFYSFLSQNDILSKQMLTCKSSEFLKCYEKYIRLDARLLDIGEDSLEAVISILCRFPFFQTFFEGRLSNSFIKFSLQVSQLSTDYDKVAALVNIWCSLNTSEYNSNDLKLMFNFNIEEQIEELTCSEMTKKIQWLTILAENGFLQKIFSVQELQVSKDIAWNIIEKNLYCRNEFGRLETVIVPQGRGLVLKSLLKLCLALGIPEKNIIEAAFDSECVESKSSSLQKTTKGEIFQEMLLSELLFCKSMLNFSDLANTIRIEKLGTVIEGFLASIKRKKSLKEKFGSELFKNVVEIWIPLSVNCDSYSVARILQGLAALDIEKCRNSLELSTWWCSADMMGGRRLSLKEKSEFIGFLGLFALSRDPNLVNQILLAAEKVAMYDLHSELKWEEEESQITKYILQLLLVYEKIPKNFKLLEVLIVAVAKSSIIAGNNCMKISSLLFKEVKKRLIKIVNSLIENKETKEQAQMASCIYQTIVKSEQVRKNLIVCKICLIPVVVTISTPAAKKFYTEQLCSLISIIDETKGLSNNVEELHLKTVAFNLIEMIPHKCGADFSKSPALNDIYQNKQESDGIPRKDHKSVLKAVTLACIAFKRSLIPPGVDYLVRQAMITCNNASYNAVASNLISTSSTPKILEGVLIHEDGIKSFLWENIIDSKVEYNFPVIMEMTLDPDLDTVSNDTDQNSKQINSEVQANPATNNRIQLAGSSLAADAAQYDFTGALTVCDSTFYQRVFGLRKKLDEEVPVCNIPSVTIVNWNEINKHESMLSFVATLKKLTSLYEAMEQKVSCPPWVLHLQKLLGNEKQHSNVKLFIIGAMLNCQETLQVYSEYFIEPILKLLIYNQQIFGREKLNCFVKETIVMLLSWCKAKDIIPNEKYTTEMLSYVIDNVEHLENASSRRDVYEHNLLLFRAIIENWKIETVHFPSVKIMEKLSAKSLNFNPKIGLAVCKQIFSTGKLPAPDEQKLMKEFCRFLSNSSKPIYCSSAENIGLLLKYLKDTEYENMEKALDFTKQKIMAEKVRPIAFVNILLHTKKYPELMTLLKPSVLEMLSNTNVRSLTISLISTCFSLEIKEAEDKKLIADQFFSDLAGRKLFDQPCNSIQEAEAGVEILENFADNLVKPSNLLKVVNWLNMMEYDTENGKLRARYVRCVLKLYKLMHSLNYDKGIQNTLLKVFVRLFKDEDEEVKEAVHEFWTDNLKEWSSSPNLILELLELIGDQKNSLEIILGLIMKRCSAAPDYHKDIFDKPLEDCRFFEYNLDTSWRMKHASLQPLFAESLSSAQNFSTLRKSVQDTLKSQRMSVGKFGVNLLRATLSLANRQFSPTMQQQDSVDDDERMDIDFDDFQFIPQNQETLETTPSSIESDPLSYLRKRFYQRPQSEFFAKQEVDRQKTRFELSVEKAKIKRSNVKLARSYRVGELPDILIKHSDLLTTVTNLSKLDDEVGRNFLVPIFTGMVKASYGLDHLIQRNLMEKAEETFHRLFKNHGQVLNPSLAASIIEISILNTISIRPTLTTSVCSQLNLHELGILNLERHISTSDTSTNIVLAKKAKMDPKVDESENAWLRIAELYKELEEFDVLRNVFLIASSNSQVQRNAYATARKALYLESEGNVEDAMGEFEDLFRHYKNNPENYDSALGKFAEDAFLNCVAKISNWDQLFEEGYKCQNEENSLPIKTREFSKTSLSLTVQSGLQITFEQSDPEMSETEALIHFKKFMLEMGEMKANFLNTNYPIEQALFIACKDLQNTAKSSVLLDKGWNIGVNEFKLFPKLSQPQRRQKALMLQQASVLQDFFNWSKGGDKNNIEQKTRKFVSKLEKLCNHGMSSLVNGDIVVSERAYFLRQFMDHDLIKENKVLFEQLKRVDFHQHLWIMALGLRDKNLPVSNKYLEKSQILVHGLTDEYMLEFKRVFIDYLFTFHNRTPIKQWIKMWSSAWKKTEKSSTTNDLDDTFEQQAQLLRCLIDATFHCADTIDPKLKKTVINAVGLSSNSNSQGAASFQNVVQEGSNKLFTSIENHSFNKSSKANNAGFQLYSLANSLIKRMPDQYANDERIWNLMAKCLLQSIDSDDAEGLLLFPRILPLLDKFESLRETFVIHARCIPTWKFLPWLDQILTSYRSSDTLKLVLKPLVDRIVEEYPQALQLQYVDLLSSSSSVNMQELYTKSVRALVLPKILHKSFEEKLARCLQYSNTSKTIEVLTDFRTELRKICDDDQIYGTIHIHYATEMIDVVDTQLLNIENLKGNENSENSQSSETSVSRKTASDIKTSINEVVRRSNLHHTNAMRGYGGNIKVMELQKFSPWLAKFHHSDNKQEVEMPGLYDGLLKPDTEFHPKVVSFFPTISVYNSLTKPIKFTILGNNGKKVSFLAKHGDDLRQDRRIQQLFRISNKLFNDDFQTQKRKLSLVTYPVIPITEVFGIMQWVDKTVDLNSFILNSEDLKHNQKNAIATHVKWLEEKSGLSLRTSPPHFVYCTSAQNIDRSEAEKHFDSMSKLVVPPSHLSNHLQDRSRSLEQFFKIRHGMIRSYAAMCIVHWLLGIGDRHLQNAMLSLETGQLVGIDFGRAFGTSIYLLSIPELVPFRLSPQLNHLMSPYGCKGLFKETMLSAWRCLVNSSELILYIISVFVKEQDINWLKKRRQGEMQAAVDRKQTWMPMEVIENKLLCRNPVKLLLKELQTHQQKNIIPIYSSLIKSGREKILGKNENSQEEVIDMLLDMATDKNLLCMIYHGWSWWI